MVIPDVTHPELGRPPPVDDLVRGDPIQGSFSFPGSKTYNKKTLREHYRAIKKYFGKSLGTKLKDDWVRIQIDVGFIKQLELPFLNPLSLDAIRQRYFRIHSPGWGPSPLGPFYQGYLTLIRTGGSSSCPPNTYKGIREAIKDCEPKIITQGVDMGFETEEEEGMEKLGVITEQDDSSKTASAEIRCPLCDRVPINLGGVFKCTKHGSAPFEGTKDGNDKKEDKS